VYHKTNTDGSISPQVNSAFPDMKGLVASIHALGLRAGWYLNDCLSYCFRLGDTCGDECNAGDVAAMLEFNFDSLKLDGCSAQHNTSLWASLLASSSVGPRVLLENCHNSGNPTKPIAEGGCPDYHTFRTSTDIRNTYGSWIGNAQSVLPFLADGRHGPTCWAYSDMAMVGVQGDINGASFPPSLTEQRTHYGLWAILSVPITLSLDLSNATTVDRVWPIITNLAVLNVSQSWAGSPGGLFASSSATVTLEHCTPDWDGDKNCTVPEWQAFAKPLGGGSVAVMFLNHGPRALPASFAFSSVPGLTACSTSCSVFDLWQQQGLGSFSGSYTVPALASHDAVFVRLSAPALGPAAAGQRVKERV